jgi:hypothetical protein
MHHDTPSPKRESFNHLSLSLGTKQKMQGKKNKKKPCTISCFFFFFYFVFFLPTDWNPIAAGAPESNTNAVENFMVEECVLFWGLFLERSMFDIVSCCTLPKRDSNCTDWMIWLQFQLSERQREREMKREREDWTLPASSKSAFRREIDREVERGGSRRRRAGGNDEWRRFSSNEICVCENKESNLLTFTYAHRNLPSHFLRMTSLGANCVNNSFAFAYN